MKVNKKALPLKVHYFCFLGCVSPILPFLIVVGLQLGIPVSVMGTLVAVSLLLVVLMKPIVATLADAFPSYRRSIFLMTLFIMAMSLSSLDFVPPVRGGIRVAGQVVMPGDGLQVGSRIEKSLYAGSSPAAVTNPPPPPSAATAAAAAGEETTADHPLLLTHDEADDCYVSVAWDCVVSCRLPSACLPDNSTTPGTIRITALGRDRELQVLQGSREALNSYTVDGDEAEGSPLLVGVLGQVNDRLSGRLYELEGLADSWDPLMANISVTCEGGQWAGRECHEAWNYWPFWMFATLLFVGHISFNVAISVTDAIIVDIIGEDGDYGLQRAWGTVGWGLMGPISGLLIDWWSGTSITKSYSPAFLICFLLGSADVILSAACIQVPQMKTDRNILKKVLPIIRQPRFFVFCCFVILNGSFDGVVASYIFIMQEDMARGTGAMAYMKFLQGFTLFVQCGIEAPFMFINSWFMRKLGAHYVISLVFFLYIFRLLGLAVVGAYGPVWSTLLVEFLNGPCYGLGYTAVVVHAAKLSPPGTSTTVQSVVNLCYESIGYALAMFAGGHLYSALGGPGMYLTAGLTAVITFLLHLISLRFLPPSEKAGNAKAPSEKEDGNVENAVLSAENAVQSDDEGNIASREKEVSSDADACVHSVTDIEMTQELKDSVEHL